MLGALARPLIREGGMTVKDLIGFLDVSRQSLTAVLDRLERRGWVERAKDNDDGRSRRIRLSPESKTIWARMHSAPSPRRAARRMARQWSLRCAQPAHSMIRFSARRRSAGMAGSFTTCI